MQREFRLRWTEAADIDFDTIVMFGTGIIFGSTLAAFAGTRNNDA